MDRDRLDGVGRLRSDLLVIGGGMAGLAAGAYAAERGARVILVERAAAVGGSALLSAGGLLRPVTVEDFQTVNPSGDVELVSVLVEQLDDAAAWISSLGVRVDAPVRADELLGYAALTRSHDVGDFVQRCERVIHANDGWVVTSCEVLRLLVDDGRVTGAVVRDRDGEAMIEAPWTLLATGGFQNDAELRRRYLGAGAEAMLVRSNPNSAGVGLRLGLEAGGAVTSNMHRFYGHTIPTPLDHEFGPGDYRRLVQPEISPRSVILDPEGRRFTDESLGYYVNAQAVCHQLTARALLVGDQHIRDADRGSVVDRALGNEQLDRIREAATVGAHVAEAATLEELGRAVEPWGYRGVAAAVDAFNAALGTDPDGLVPARRRHRHPLVSPPYFAMEIQAVITATFGGLRVDRDARVLDADGEPVPGLLAAGNDAGGLSHETYGGGLGFGLVLGLQAARQALADVTV